MATLNWFIDKDHFAAHTEYGTYEVGDWGGGLSIVVIPGGISEKTPHVEAKDVAQADYDRRQVLDLTVKGAVA